MVLPPEVSGKTGRVDTPAKYSVTNVVTCDASSRISVSEMSSDEPGFLIPEL
jgi:hypothetical protein